MDIYNVLLCGRWRPWCCLAASRACNRVIVVTILEHGGGAEAFRRFVEIFYGHCLADPLIGPLFGGGRPEHVPRLTAFEVETFGGPDGFTREHGGMPALIAVHRRLKITEEQRQRFVDLYMASADEAGLPADEPFRATLRSHVEFGTEVAKQNSHAETDAELHPLRTVPIWDWEKS
ncbi:group II truncated hemoglobin [Spirillospora sp. NPDC048911]|uniref:group II truncated hemoglobin n=1 Tax=Spirillospora sp. NPDC048911 TaxID=3364527 RepID=UPI0037146B80